MPTQPLRPPLPQPLLSCVETRAIPPTCQSTPSNAVQCNAMQCCRAVCLPSHDRSVPCSSWVHVCGPVRVRPTNCIVVGSLSVTYREKESHPDRQTDKQTDRGKAADAGGRESSQQSHTHTNGSLRRSVGINALITKKKKEDLWGSIIDPSDLDA